MRNRNWAIACMLGLGCQSPSLERVTEDYVESPPSILNIGTGQVFVRPRAYCIWIAEDHDPYSPWLHRVNSLSLNYKSPGVLVESSYSTLSWKSYSQPRTGEYYPNVDGKPERLALRSTDESIARVTFDEQGRTVLDAYSPGKFQVEIALGASLATLALEVRQIPVRRGMTKNDVIELFGIPDSEELALCAWYEAEIIDSVAYYGRADRDVSGSHWRYREFPHAVFAFDRDNRLRVLATDSSYLHQSPYTLVKNRGDVEIRMWRDDPELWNVVVIDPGAWTNSLVGQSGGL